MITITIKKGFTFCNLLWNKRSGFSLRFVTIICVLLIFFSCTDTEKKQQNSVKHIDSEKLKDQFVKANKLLIQKENDEMDYYAKSHQMAFIKTNSGIRYYIYKASISGDSIKPGDAVKMNFTVSLLNGTECYSSKTLGEKIFKVEEHNIESGIHIAIQFLKTGDKALILIPSHLAHGLLGDMDKIPPQTPILYDVEVLDVRKNL